MSHKMTVKKKTCHLIFFFQTRSISGTSLAVQWLGFRTSIAGRVGSVLGQGRSHLLCGAAKK